MRAAKKLVGHRAAWGAWVSGQVKPARDRLNAEGSEVDGAMQVCSVCLHLLCAAGLGNSFFPLYSESLTHANLQFCRRQGNPSLYN